MLFKQKHRNYEIKGEQFQEDVYQTVQSLSKEMNEAFAMMHKNLNLQKNLTSKNVEKEKSEHLDMVSKITDQNVKNVFTALERHKVSMEDRMNRMEDKYDRLRGDVAATDDPTRARAGKLNDISNLSAGRAALSDRALMQDLQLKNEHLDAQIRTINEKIMRSDEQMQHYGSALEEVARQVESSNRFTANQLYNQNLQLQNSAIRGAPQEGPTLSKIINKSELGELRKDFLLLVQEISNDKLDVLREVGNLNTQVKSKIDALSWHARCLNLVTVNQIQEALTLFKRSLLPSDNAQIRNVYIKMMDHRSSAIIHLSTLLRTEALQEKMTLTGNKN